jgi:hypothetical protein
MQGEIRVLLWQGPDRMQMVWQDHGRFGREVVPRPHLAKRRPLGNSADSLPSCTEQPVRWVSLALNPSYALRKPTAPSGKPLPYS